MMVDCRGGHTGPCKQALANPDLVPETVAHEIEQRLMMSNMTKQEDETRAEETQQPPEPPVEPPVEAPRPDTPETAPPKAAPQSTSPPPPTPTPIPPQPTPTNEVVAAHRATEAAELKAKLAAAEARNATLTSHTVRLQSTVELLQSQVAELNQELTTMAASKEADALELARLREQLQDAMMSKGANTSLLEAQLTLARAELAVAQEDTATWVDERQSLTQQLIEAKIEAATATERLLMVEHDAVGEAAQEGAPQQRSRFAKVGGGLKSSLKNVLRKNESINS